MERAASDARAGALMKTPLLSSHLHPAGAGLPARRRSPQTSSLHGVLMDVFGVGILLLGKSGIGKSEIALDLVMRGHRLVADDIVDVTRRKAGTVYGAGNAIIKHHMEIRGLGIINIKDLFGVAAVRERKKIELVIELVEWDPTQASTTGWASRSRSSDIVDVEVPLLGGPGAPGPQHDHHHRGGRAQPPAQAAGPPLRARSSPRSSTSAIAAGARCADIGDEVE